MKTLLSIIIFLFTFVAVQAQAQEIEQELLTSQISTAINAHEVFVENQDKRINILQIENIKSKIHFFSEINTFVNSHDDIRFFKPWLQHQEYDYIYMSSVVYNKYLFILYYSHQVKKLIIRSIGLKIE